MCYDRSVADKEKDEQEHPMYVESPPLSRGTIYSPMVHLEVENAEPPYLRSCLLPHTSRALFSTGKRSHGVEVLHEDHHFV